MKISLNWLNEWIDTGLDAAALGDRLTMAGFELESITTAAPAFSGVKVAKILEANPHPQADKLRVCTVDIGAGETLQIVCGAANARAGLYTALAMVGARLPNDLHIKAAKLRGVESAGMLCSAKELGLAETSEGIVELPEDAAVGADLRDYLGLDDRILELSVTPNRGDAMSMRGIAREVAALTAGEWTTPDCSAVMPAHDLTPTVLLAAPQACARFHARVIVDVDNRRSSPVWLRERLRRAGIRSISPVVDVTNYIVLELGQPMHAYDYDKLHGAVSARQAATGETVELLDGRRIELAPDVLVIADERAPLALAGVMGGLPSSVTADTRRVLFEVAWFAPAAIAGRGRRYGLTTDASQRFERGVDPEVGQLAIERATRLLLEVAGGLVGPLVRAESPEHLPTRRDVTLRLSQVQRLLGCSVAQSDATAILQRLGLSAGGSQGEALIFTAPSHRFDLNIERDLIEELARLIGYGEIPTVPAQVAQNIQLSKRDAGFAIDEQRVLDVLAARGYHEGIHFSFVEPGLQSKLFPQVSARALSNPISSDLAAMRVSLWPGLLKAATENQRRQQPRLRLFEHGVVFLPDGSEVDRLAGLAMGARWPEQWAETNDLVDFFDVRTDLESVLSLTGPLEDVRFEIAALDCLHPGRSARVFRAGRAIGWIGELHPLHVREFEFSSAPILFEIDLDAALVEQRQDFSEPSKFPQVRRDLAFVVDDSVSYAEVRRRVFQAASSALRDVVLFDIYRGAGIEVGRKSMALGLILQDKDRTLTDEETDSIVTAVRSSLSEGLQASFRG